MTFPHERHRKWLCILGAMLCIAVLVHNNAARLDSSIETLREARLLDADAGKTLRGVWYVWQNKTIDYEVGIHTGFYYYTSAMLGAALTPVMGNSLNTFAIATRVNALIQGSITVLLATAVAGAMTGWSLWALLIPVFLVFNPHFNFLSATARVDISMLLWLALVPWAYARFMQRPNKRTYKWSMILTTLAFCSKPSVLPMFLYFVGLNAWQVLRDRQRFFKELRWRFRKGLKYFLLTLLIASPTTFFSFGLFVTSMKSALTEQSHIHDYLPWTKWFDILLDPAYLGGGLLLVVLAALTVHAICLWMGRRNPRPRERDLGLIFLWVNLCWTVLFWGFIVIRTRNFIDRYLDPGILSFLFLSVALAVWLGKQPTPLIRWLGRGAGFAFIVLVLVSVPNNYEKIAATKAYAKTEHAVLLPHRKFRREFEALVPPSARLLISSYTNVSAEHFPQISRFWYPQPRHFDIAPEYLVINSIQHVSITKFIDFDDMSYKGHEIRRAAAIFLQEVERSNLYGTLDLVKKWETPEVYLFRFNRPADLDYANWLFERIYNRIGIPQPLLEKSGGKRRPAED